MTLLGRYSTSRAIDYTFVPTNRRLGSEVMQYCWGIYITPITIDSRVLSSPSTPNGIPNHPAIISRTR